MRLLIVSLSLFLFSFNCLAVTKAQLLEQISTIGEAVQVNDNVVNFNYRGIPEVLIFDEAANRMRLMSPIVEVQQVDNGLLLNALEANFHSVLDARYAVSNDVIWSVFIHPLDDLSESLLGSAVSQVAVAHATFGREFTSGDLIFPSNN